MKLFAIATFVGLVVLFTGCKDEDTPQSGGPSPATTSGSATPAGGPHDADHKDADDHPNRVPLGEKSVGGMKLVASQDEPIKPGGEGAFDLVITGGGKPKAVRFWVGTESGEGSVKAKAEEETPENWHVHTEVPDPLPPGSKFWAEVEPPTGEKFTVSFDLKVQ